MPDKFFSRRSFINQLGLGGAAIGLNALVSACMPLQNSRPIPAGMEPDLELAIRALPAKIQILDGQATDVWKYEGEVVKGPQDALQVIPGSYLGPIVHARKGQAVRVTFANQIPEPSIIHWHGLHVPESADGHPRLVIDNGESYVYEFMVMDRAGMYWYHPHPHGRTATQVYNGMAGLFIVHDDEEESLDLPSGEYDLPLVIQDRTFDADNQLEYHQNEVQVFGFLGERALVNGQPDYEISAAARPYRLRILNGSNARIYNLAWNDGSPLTVIGTDGGLLESPVERNFIVLAPGERTDLWFDLGGYKIGDQLRLLNVDLSGGISDADTLFTLNINRVEDSELVLPEKLASLTLRDWREAVNLDNPRTFTLSMGMGMRWLLNGKTFEMEAVSKDEEVKLGDLEIWEFTNQGNHGMGMGMGMANIPHPMHIHGVQFQVIERQSESRYKEINDLVNRGHVDEGWHDTVLVMPGERVKVLVKFEDYEGLYLYHCHNLEHEDMGMMRNYRITA